MNTEYLTIYLSIVHCGFPGTCPVLQAASAALVLTVNMDAGFSRLRQYDENSNIRASGQPQTRFALFAHRFFYTSICAAV